MPSYYILGRRGGDDPPVLGREVSTPHMALYKALGRGVRRCAPPIAIILHSGGGRGAMPQPQPHCILRTDGIYYIVGDCTP